jgi:hypothetical protein
MKELFRLPNQLPLFFLLKLVLLFIVAGEPGRSGLKLSDEDIERRPRYLRTEDGRMLDDGLAGASELPLASILLVCWSSDAGARSVDSAAGGKPASCGKKEVVGVGWESRGPLPGVGGRGLSGGESRGAGMGVPSVREKFMGASVSGWYLSGILSIFSRQFRWCNQDD